MFSWGPECKLLLGAYGGVTFDYSKNQFVNACDSWTTDRLPYSCTPLKILPMPKSTLTGGAAPLPNIDVEKHIDAYRKQYPQSYVPEATIRDMLLEEKSAAGALPRHSLLGAYENDSRDINMIHAVGSTLNFTPLYYELESTVPQLIADWSERKRHHLQGNIRKIACDRAKNMAAALTSCHRVYLYKSNGYVSFDIISDEDLYDITLSHSGSTVLLAGKSGCRLFDCATSALANSWAIDTLDGIRHSCVMTNQIYMASSVNTLVLLDHRSPKAHCLPFDIGGQPLSLTTGALTNTVAYLSGPERLVALDLRRPKQPILQWMSEEFFGGPLAMLHAVNVEHGDLLTGCNLSTEEIMSVPVVPQPSINTISSLTPAIHSSLNVNRLYVTLKDRQQMCGHAWLTTAASGQLSLQLTMDGRIAYQHHSFNHKYDGVAYESFADLSMDSDSHPTAMSKQQNFSHLLHRCTESSGMKRYIEVSGSQQDALSSWHVPTKANKYIPRLLSRAMSIDRPVAVADVTLLSSAAKILHKQW